MSNPDVVPIITAAEAIQALIEAIHPLKRDRPQLREPLARARRKRVELMMWVDEQR